MSVGAMEVLEDFGTLVGEEIVNVSGVEEAGLQVVHVVGKGYILG